MLSCKFLLLFKIAVFWAVMPCSVCPGYRKSEAQKWSPEWRSQSILFPVYILLFYMVRLFFCSGDGGKRILQNSGNDLSLYQYHNPEGENLRNVHHEELKCHVRISIVNCPPCNNFRILKFVTALHVSAYLAVIRCVKIWGNCRAFRITAIRVFVFAVFLNEVNVGPPPMPHVLSFLVPLLSI